MHSAISLIVGVAVLISLVIGLFLGVSGFKGGRTDAVISWSLQVFGLSPHYLWFLAITLAFGKGFMYLLR